MWNLYTRALKVKIGRISDAESSRRREKCENWETNKWSELIEEGIVEP